MTPAAGPAPVMVFLRQDGLLERFLDEQSGCTDARFSVQRESATDALVLYLEPTGDGGYTFEARRSSADALVLEGRPRARGRHAGRLGQRRRRALAPQSPISSRAAVGHELHRDGREDEPHHALEDRHARRPSTRCTSPRRPQDDVGGDEGEHDRQQHRDGARQGLALGHQHHHRGDGARAREQRHRQRHDRDVLLARARQRLARRGARSPRCARAACRAR